MLHQLINLKLASSSNSNVNKHHVESDLSYILLNQLQEQLSHLFAKMYHLQD